MIEWKERRTGLGIAYKPCDQLGPIPRPPRAVFDAVGQDGAKLEAYRWGSPLGEPFVLEIRRFGAPDLVQFVDKETWQMLPNEPLGRTVLSYHDAEPPHLGELQAAVDQLVPPGVLMLLALASSGPDATYPEAVYCAVRVMQPVGPPEPASRIIQ